MYPSNTNWKNSFNSLVAGDTLTFHAGIPFLLSPLLLIFMYCVLFLLSFSLTLASFIYLYTYLYRNLQHQWILCSDFDRHPVQAYHRSRGIAISFILLVPSLSLSFSLYLFVYKRIHRHLEMWFFSLKTTARTKKVSTKY